MTRKTFNIVYVMITVIAVVYGITYYPNKYSDLFCVGLSFLSNHQSLFSLQAKQFI